MKNIALGDDVSVDLGEGIVSQLDGAASKSRQHILDEMELQESVEKDGGSYGKSAKVVRDWDVRERTEEEIVGTRGPVADPLLGAGGFHGY